MWSVSATGKPADVRASISKQFGNQAPVALAVHETVRQSAKTFIDGVLAQITTTQPIRIDASGMQGVSHPDCGVQISLSIEIRCQQNFFPS